MKPSDRLPERRTFLQQAVSIVGAVPLVALAVPAPDEPHTAQETKVPAPVPTPAVAYESLSPDEASFIEALVNVMCPADEFTPNGVDCGLAVFIDRQLAGAFGKGLRRYQRAPFRQGTPQHGEQSPLTPEQLCKVGIAAANAACLREHGKAFDQLDAAQADAFLKDLHSGKVVDERLSLQSWFNDLIYPLFQQACFSDPMYGGNRGKAFWKLIGYPGLPAMHALDVVRYRGKQYPGAQDPKSIADFA